MSNTRYIVGTGWFHGKQTPESERYKQAMRWLDNVRRHCSPERIVVVAQGGTRFEPGFCEVVHLSGDLGSHVHLCHTRQKNNEFSGWFGAVFALAMLAYNNESDLVFQEQDCLVFGDCVGRMYREIGEGGIIFGRAHRGPPHQPCSQALFLLKYNFIREFVCKVFGSAPMRSLADLGESKFIQQMERNPSMWKQFDFGYDRERPFDIKDKEFYVQQVTPQEIEFLTNSGMIEKRFA